VNFARQITAVVSFFRLSKKGCLAKEGNVFPFRKKRNMDLAQEIVE
jgi:hypothetical protein